MRLLVYARKTGPRPTRSRVREIAAALDDILDPEAFCLGFEYRCRMTRTKVIKAVDSLERL